MSEPVPMELVGVRIELPTQTPILLLREQGGTRFLPIWIGTRGMYPSTNLAELGPKIEDLDENDQPETPPTVHEWAQNHGFLDRLRLALPWKWGLLPRAMRNRW